MSRPDDLPALPQIHIPEPCPMKWHELHRDDESLARDARRYCDRCEKHVLNFSEMTSPEINAALQSGQSVCAQMQRRSDGSIVTNDDEQLPVCNRRDWLGRFAAVAASFFGLATLIGCDQGRVQRFLSRFKSRPTPIPAEVPPEPLMGDVDTIMGGAMAPPPNLQRPSEVQPPLDKLPEPIRGRVQITPEMLGKVRPAPPQPDVDK